MCLICSHLWNAVDVICRLVLLHVHRRLLYCLLNVTSHAEVPSSLGRDHICKDSCPKVFKSLQLPLYGGHVCKYMATFIALQMMPQQLTIVLCTGTVGLRGWVWHHENCTVPIFLLGEVKDSPVWYELVHHSYMTYLNLNCQLCNVIYYIKTAKLSGGNQLYYRTSQKYIQLKFPVVASSNSCPHTKVAQ